MKYDKAIEEIGSILLQLDSQEDLDEVVSYMSNFKGGSGESAMSLEELKEEKAELHLDGAFIQEEKDSHGLEGFIPDIPDAEWDPDAPEDGGHPY
jgi:hypothetical protein